MDAAEAQQAYRHVLEHGGVAMEPRGDDAALNPRFEKRAVYMKHKSEQEGRPIYQDQIFVIIPLEDGVHHGVVRKPDAKGEEQFTQAGLEFIQRFPRQWAAFEAGETNQLVGTPLNQWPGMTPSRAKHYEYHDIYTVEQLVASPDSKIQGCGMGAKDEQRKAKAYLDASKDAAGAMAAAAENEKLRQQLAAMQSQVDEMNEKFTKQLTNKKPAQTKRKETKEDGNSE